MNGFTILVENNVVSFLCITARYSRGLGDGTYRRGYAVRSGASGRRVLRLHTESTAGRVHCEVAVFPRGQRALFGQKHYTYTVSGEYNNSLTHIRLLQSV